MKLKRWTAALGLIGLGLCLMAPSCEDLPPGVPCFPGGAVCDCYVKQDAAWFLRVCPSPPPASPPPVTQPPGPPSPCPSCPPQASPPASPPVSPPPPGPPSPPPASEPPPAFPPQPFDVRRGHGLLSCTIPGQGNVCQGGLTKSQNDEVPQCLDGAKPKAHPNAPPFKIAAGMTCFIDSTAKIGLCDPLTLKAISIARKNGRPEDIQGWVCPNDPDPARRFENPCNKVDTEGKLQTCGLDQWIEAIGGCDDLKVLYKNNGKKIAEECQKRWPVSDTSWMAQGPCTLTPEAGGIGAVIKVTGSGCKIMSCASDGRIPNATGCVTRVLGQKN